MRASGALAERKITRTLYKALMHSARTFEREPALKALLSRNSSPLMKSTPTEEESSCLSELYDEFLGSQQACFYHPELATQSTLPDIIRRRFRQPLPPSPEAREAAVDAGFRALQHLEEATAVGRSIGLISTPDRPIEEERQAQPETKRSLARAASMAEVGAGMLLVPHPLLMDPFWHHTVILLLNYSPETGAYGAVINRPESRFFMRTAEDGQDDKADKKSEGTSTTPEAFKTFYGGPVAWSDLYWLSRAEPTTLPPAQEVYPGLSYGRTHAIFDWGRPSWPDASTTSPAGEPAKSSTAQAEEENGKNEKESDAGLIVSVEQRTGTTLTVRMWSNPDVKWFNGVASWTPGQLEREFQEGTWFVARPEGTEVVFPDPPLFSTVSLPPGETVDVADRDKQTRVWADLLRAMGGPYEPLARFGSLPRPKSDQSEFTEDMDMEDEEEETTEEEEEEKPGRRDD